jgi:hypothetical protein
MSNVVIFHKFKISFAVVALWDNHHATSIHITALA